MSGFLVRNKKVLGYVDRGSILLVVYTAFSEGMVRGVWHQISVARLLALLAAEAVLLAAMLALSWYGAKRLGFGRGDRIAIQFAGSKKSLAAGLPMASVLFGAQASLAVLPLMLFHQMQLDGVRGDRQTALARSAHRRGRGRSRGRRRVGRDLARRGARPAVTPADFAGRRWPVAVPVR